MENGEMKACPYCREMIKAEAVKCRYCGSMLTGKLTFTGYWYRVNKGKKIAGVCTGIAREFNSEKLILPLRLFFIMSTILSGFGLIIYIVLWMIMPAPIDYPEKIQITDTVSWPAPERKKKTEIPAQQTPGPYNTVLGLILITLGVLLITWLLAGGFGLSVPFLGRFHIPKIMPHHMNFWMGWTSGLWSLIIIAGLFLIVLGGLRFFRFLIGCGLVFLGSILIIIFIPFLPMALLPIVLIIGSVLIILGGVMFVVGLLRS